jgi:hypothetical protein
LYINYHTDERVVNIVSYTVYIYEGPTLKRRDEEATRQDAEAYLMTGLERPLAKHMEREEGCKMQA